MTSAREGFRRSIVFGPCCGRARKGDRGRARARVRDATGRAIVARMDASRDGISKLMLAEKEAQAIVSAAREGANAKAIETTGRRTTGGTRRGD